jgi:hypothetical protein
MILGTNGRIPAAFLNEFLANEKLPSDLGWVKPSDEINLLNFAPVSGYYLGRELVGFGLEEKQAKELAEESIRNFLKRN